MVPDRADRLTSRGHRSQVLSVACRTDQSFSGNSPSAQAHPSLLVDPRRAIRPREHDPKLICLALGLFQTSPEGCRGINPSVSKASAACERFLGGLCDLDYLHT